MKKKKNIRDNIHCNRKNELCIQFTEIRNRKWKDKFQKQNCMQHTYTVHMCVFKRTLLR